jgi:hypothetical protein
MSYTRFSFSDTYIYMSPKGLVCTACRIVPEKGGNPWDNYLTNNTESMISHIAEHRVAGHYVPEETESWLLKDDELNFPRKD